MADTVKETVEKPKAAKKEKAPKVEKVEAGKVETDQDVKIEAKEKLEKASEEKELKPILDKKPAQKVKNENWGILHIFSSYNNTHLHITDITGTETIAKVTGGMVTKSDRLKATPNIAMAAAKQISEACHQNGITSLFVKLRAVGGHNGPLTPGPGAQAAIRMLTRYGIKLGRIEDVTPMPHDSCRRKGGKRGRRV